MKITFNDVKDTIRELPDWKFALATATIIWSVIVLLIVIIAFLKLLIDAVPITGPIILISILFGVTVVSIWALRTSDNIMDPPK